MRNRLAALLAAVTLCGCWTDASFFIAADIDDDSGAAPESEVRGETRDVGGVDAGATDSPRESSAPSLDGASGGDPVIGCGATSCAIGSACCQVADGGGSSVQCANAADCRSTGLFFLCDDSADCPTGYLCCGHSSRSQCSPTCDAPLAVFCHRSADCPLPGATCYEASNGYGFCH